MLAAQIAAVIIFIAMFLLIVWDRFERHYITLICGGLTLLVVFALIMRSPAAILDTLSLGDISTVPFWHDPAGAGDSSTGINWSTIIFIGGMMIMVEGMARAGFFRWLCMRLAKMVCYRLIPLFIVFMIMSFGLAMFIDSITVILFLAAVSIELSKLLKFDPVPLILSEVFCANLGGSATMCGDPPNIIVGTSLGYTFRDFITNTGPIAFISLFLILIYFYFTMRREFTRPDGETVDYSAIPSPESAIVSRRDFAISWVIFLVAVALLVTHAATGLTVAMIGVLIAAFTLLSAGRHWLSVIRLIDYKTLLFFVGLFLVVGGLEKTEVLEMIAGLIGTASNGNIFLMIAIIIWVSAIASAFVDNIPFAATMIPVIKSLSAAQGVPLPTLAWTLAIGTDIGGSATPIGASANVVGTSVAAKNGHLIRWGRYCKVSVPATVIVIAVAMIYIFVRYC